MASSKSKPTSEGSLSARAFIIPILSLAISMGSILLAQVKAATIVEAKTSFLETSLREVVVASRQNGEKLDHLESKVDRILGRLEERDVTNALRSRPSNP